MTKDTLMIKDITDELDSLLQWQVFLAADEDDDASEFGQKLEDPNFFSVVKATEGRVKNFV